MDPAVDKLPDPSSIDAVDLNGTNVETSSIQVASTNNTNGIGESDIAENLDAGNVDLPASKLSPNAETNKISDLNEPPNTEDKLDVTSTLPENSEVEVIRAEDADRLIKPTKEEQVTQDKVQSPGIIDNIEINQNCQINDVQTEEVVVVESVDIPLGIDNVRFETEVLVETNDNDIHEISIAECKADVHDSSNNILSEINQSIELNEVLCSSDVTENVENNNCTLKHEVFNKEELLDILEGNDVQSNDNRTGELLQGHRNNTKNLESKLALDQLSRLKQKSFKKHSNEHSPKKKSYVAKKRKTGEERKETNKTEEINRKEGTSKKEESNKKEDHNKKEENIVNVLVRDWEDEDAVEEEAIIESISSNIPAQDLKNDNHMVKDEKRSSVDSITSEGQNSVNKSCDDNQPQRRLGRVIKKKVIFDPDNPDTFTKRKTYNKNKELHSDKDQPPLKKGKIEQITQRAKSKSPVSNLQWKKPSSKNSNKQNKRLTEVDKLLMDEGAVNMIYQLTPEAPKGKKNMKTKAEFIKKLQSSTPESKEMKFRERKKESCKGEDGEPKKILSGKHRSSLNSSVKSPSTCEDFETHSADDSIIYRRHSSSSYSSSCMSPRRLSDVDTSSLSVNVSQSNDPKPKLEAENASATGVFQPDNSAVNEIINKNDCLTIKRKLNSKLSLALTKRKRDISKTEKLIKKQIKPDKQIKDEMDNFKFLTLKFYQRVAEICVRNTGSKYNVQLLKEMSEALSYVEMRTDISVTLLTSDCGTLCSELDLQPLLNDDADKRTKMANEITESISSLLCTVAQHSKLLCSGVWGACSGLALALVALSDVAVAAEGASFALTRTASKFAPLVPGLSAVITSCRRLRQSMVDDLLIFSRQLSAFEALQGGLVSRTLFSAGFQGQLLTIAKDIANQPLQNLLLKKKLLNLGKVSEDKFLTNMETERALMVQYWTSAEGQEMIRASIQEP